MEDGNWYKISKTAAALMKEDWKARKGRKLEHLVKGTITAQIIQLTVRLHIFEGFCNCKMTKADT